MKTIILKNVSGITKTYSGIQIGDQSTYTVQNENERDNLSKNTALNLSIWNEDCIISNGVNDLSATDGDSWLKGLVQEKDSSNRQIVRLASTEKGWKLLDHYITIETSLLMSPITCKDMGNTPAVTSFYHYDTNDVLLTTQTTVDSSCVRTDIILKFGCDIEIDTGRITQRTPPTSNLYLWSAFGALDNNGGMIATTEFVRNLNLYHTSNDHFIDGKSSKLLENNVVGLAFEANQALIRVRHDTGYKHKFQVGLGYYRK